VSCKSTTNPAQGQLASGLIVKTRI